MTRKDTPLAFTIIEEDGRQVYASCGRREEDEMVRMQNVQVQFSRPEPARPVSIGRWDITTK